MASTSCRSSLTCRSSSATRGSSAASATDHPIIPTSTTASDRPSIPPPGCDPVATMKNKKRESGLGAALRAALAAPAPATHLQTHDLRLEAGLALHLPL